MRLFVHMRKRKERGSGSRGKEGGKEARASERPRRESFSPPRLG